MKNQSLSRIGRNSILTALLRTFASWSIACACLLTLSSSALGEDSDLLKLPASETISQHKLTNPSNFNQAILYASKLEASAKDLQQQGASQSRTPDLTSSLTGRHSSSDHVRQTGMANIEKSKNQVAEATRIRSDIKKVKEFYLSIAGSSDSAQYITIIGKAGQKLEVQIIGLYDNNIVVRRKSNGELVGLGFQHLQTNSADLVVKILSDKMHSQVGANLRGATMIQPNNSSSSIELLAETDKELLVRHPSGKIELLNRTTTGNNYALGMTQNLKALDEKIKSEAAQTKNAIAQDEADLDKLYAQTGNPQSFVVERILSFQKFPLEAHGKYIYQVSIGGNPTILVTRQTQYLTAGTGTLLLKPVGNYDVNMMDGSERTVPALVEIDQSLIDRSNEILANIEKKKSASELKIASVKKEADALRTSLSILNDNNAVIAQISRNLLEARRVN